MNRIKHPASHYYAPRPAETVHHEPAQLLPDRIEGEFVMYILASVVMGFALGGLIVASIFGALT